MPEAPEDDRAVLVARLYDEHGAALYRYAAILLGDAAAAEDAVHQVFAALLRGKRGAVGNDVHYLRRAVRNECYSMLRRRVTRAEAAVRLESVEGTPRERDPASDWYGRPAVRFGGNPLAPLTFLLARPRLAHRANAEIRLLTDLVDAARRPWPDRLQVGEPLRFSRARGFDLHSAVGAVRPMHLGQADIIARFLALVRTAGAAVAVQRFQLAAGRRAARHTRGAGARVHAGRAGGPVLGSARDLQTAG